MVLLVRASAGVDLLVLITTPRPRKATNGLTPDPSGACISEQLVGLEPAGWKRPK